MSSNPGARAPHVVVVVVAVALLAAAPAYAYIDPGTAGLVVGWGGSILAWIAIAFAAFKLRIYRVAGFLWRTARKHPAAAAVVVVVALLGGASGGAFLAAPALFSSGDETMASTSERVLLLGLDGVDPKMVRALVDKGLLPNFARLADDGALEPLAVPNPPESPVVWASLATGQNPGKHGVFDFIGRDPDRYLPELALQSRGAGGAYKYPLHASAFWDVAAKNGVPTTVIRWPMTFPPPDENLRMLAGLGVPDVRGGLGRYSFFTDHAPPAGEEGAEKVTVVVPKDGVVDTELIGPQAWALGGAKDLKLPLHVQLAPDGNGAVARIGKNTVTLPLGKWSRHVELTFTSGLFKKVAGQVKLLLVSAHDPFALFVTAVELEPDAPVVPFTQPPAYAAELKKEIGAYHTLGMPEDTKALGEGRIDEAQFLAMCKDVEGERRRMLDYELSRFDHGVLAFVFDTSDRIQHMTPIDGPVEDTAIGKYLVDFDAYLGTVLDRLPEDTAVMIFSDHGFTSFDRSFDLNRWLVDNGYMVIDEAAYAARPAGSAGELYRYVDWDKTRAYAVGFADIFINLTGREKSGIVPAGERLAVANEIKAKLAAYVDADSGQHPVHQVYTREELYQGKQQDKAPDLVVGYRAGTRGSWQTAVGGVAPAVLAPNDKKWQRDHIVDASYVPGTLVTNFPLAVEHPHAYDIAPTVLRFLSLPIPPEMDGRPLQGPAVEVATRDVPADAVVQ